MKSYDFDAIVLPEIGAIYCKECVPASVPDEEIVPIFAGDEWSAPCVCESCGKEHDYMNIVEAAYG